MARRAPRLETLWISSNPLGATPPWFPEVSPSALEPEYARERDAAVTLRRLPSHARALDLTDAALSHVPDLTARAACLTTLKLARNHLGFLPAHLSDCVALRVLHLDENRLSFLPDLSKMTRLEDLRARANRLVTLTPSVSKLTNLASLYVGRNPLTSIPDVSTCANLETLWIAECRLVALPLSLADAPLVSITTRRKRRQRSAPTVAPPIDASVRDPPGSGSLSPSDPEETEPRDRPPLRSTDSLPLSDDVAVARHSLKNPSSEEAETRRSRRKDAGGGLFPPVPVCFRAAFTRSCLLAARGRSRPVPTGLHNHRRGSNSLPPRLPEHA